MLSAVAIEVMAVALLLQNRETWFGMSVSYTKQSVLALIVVAIFVIVYMIHTDSRFPKDVL
jgi:uncharacterized membrane protein